MRQRFLPVQKVIAPILVSVLIQAGMPTLTYAQQCRTGRSGTGSAGLSREVESIPARNVRTGDPLATPAIAFGSNVPAPDAPRGGLLSSVTRLTEFVEPHTASLASRSDSWFLSAQETPARSSGTKKKAILVGIGVATAAAGIYLAGTGAGARSAEHQAYCIPVGVPNMPYGLQNTCGIDVVEPYKPTSSRRYLGYGLISGGAFIALWGALTKH